MIRIEQMKDEIIDMYLNKNLDTVQNNKVSKSTCYHVWWSGTQAKAIYDFMYKDCGDYYLNRKFEKFDKAFNK